MYDLGIRLNYQKENSNIIYKADDFFFNENECNTSFIFDISSSYDADAIIFPNPVKNEFTILTDGLDRLLDIEIRSLSGQTLIRKKINSADKINVEDLAKGTYFLIIDQTKLYKFIKV